MKLVQETAQHLKAFSIPALVLFVLVYTYYQLLTGDRGLLVWYELSQQVNLTKQQNAALAQQKEMLGTKVARLRPETLDLDFVDELIRRTLPMMRKDEIVLYLPQPTK